MASIDTVEGIGPTYKEKLKEAGVKTTEALLKEGARPAGRKALAERSDIRETMILEWVNRCDLMRVKGIGEEYSDLLEFAGVDTVVELAGRNAVNLTEAMQKMNDEKSLVRVTPSLSSVEDWIAQSKDLGRGVFY